MMASNFCLSVAYIGPKSRIERSRKTKIGPEVAHVTRDSDTTFKVKRSKVKVTGGEGILWRPPTQLVIISIPSVVKILRVKNKSQKQISWNS